MARWKGTQLVSMKMQARSLALLSGSGMQHCRELWCRSQTHSDPMWLWLRCRLAAAALIPPLLAWEFPFAEGAALGGKKK